MSCNVSLRYSAWGYPVFKDENWKFSDIYIYLKRINSVKYSATSTSKHFTFLFHSVKYSTKKYIPNI